MKNSNSPSALHPASASTSFSNFNIDSCHLRSLSIRGCKNFCYESLIHLTQVLYYRNYLDNNLHLSILSALSSNLASTSQQDDLALLNSSFSSSNNEITSNSVLYDLIDRLNDKEKVIEGFNQILVCHQNKQSKIIIGKLMFSCTASRLLNNLMKY